MTSERLPSVIGLDAARKPDAPVVFEKSSRKKAGNVSEGSGRAGRLERQCPRTVGGVFAEGQEGAELGRGSARAAKSAAGRGDVPHRHAIAYLPGAACRRRAVRRRPAHRACLDAGGVSPHGADRQALQARPRQGPRHRRSRRRRLRLQGHARHGDDRGDRARARSEGAGPDRLRPARGIVRHRLSAGGGDEDRAAAVRAGRPQGAVAHRLCRHGRRDQLDARRAWRA